MATTALRHGTEALQHSGGSKPAATALIATSDEPQKSPKHYRGFVGGVFSGIAKLSGRWLSYPHNIHCKTANQKKSRPPIRHDKSAPANDRDVTFPRPSRLSNADTEE